MQRGALPIIAVLFAAVVSGCANYRPIVDQQSVHDTAQYERDLSDCQKYAEHVNPGATAVLGAVAGAALGAVIGAIADDPYWGLIAAGGAVGGVVAGGMDGAGDQKDIIRTCMSNRGYSVLH